MPERIEITKMKQNANNREYVMENVKKEGVLLEFASDELRDDKEVVLEAIYNNPEALEFASERLKGDRDVVYNSVSKVGWTYCYAKENLLEEIDFLREHGIKISDFVELIYELKNNGIDMQIENWDKDEIIRKIINIILLLLLTIFQKFR